MRFTELHRAIDGITARMLTVTLRGLERDGIVTRTIHPVIPPRVEYALTPMGRTLLDTIGQLVDWTDSHLPEIQAARAAYDARHASPRLTRGQSGCSAEHEIRRGIQPKTGGSGRTAAARFLLRRRRCRLRGAPS